MNFDRRKAAIADMSPSFATLVILPVILRDVFMENSNDRAASIEATSQLEEFSHRTLVIFACLGTIPSPMRRPPMRRRRPFLAAVDFAALWINSQTRDNIGNKGTAHVITPDP